MKKSLIVISAFLSFTSFASSNSLSTSPTAVRLVEALKTLVPMDCENSIGNTVTCFRGDNGGAITIGFSNISTASEQGLSVTADLRDVVFDEHEFNQFLRRTGSVGLQWVRETYDPNAHWSGKMRPSDTVDNWKALYASEVLDKDGSVSFMNIKMIGTVVQIRIEITR